MSNQISSIAVPLGATVNMDAVSIVMSFMIIFFANACGVNVSVSMMVIILLANTLLSVGTPAVSYTHLPPASALPVNADFTIVTMAAGTAERFVSRIITARIT